MANVISLSTELKDTYMVHQCTRCRPDFSRMLASLI